MNRITQVQAHKEQGGGKSRYVAQEVEPICIYFDPKIGLPVDVPVGLWEWCSPLDLWCARDYRTARYELLVHSNPYGYLYCTTQPGARSCFAFEWRRAVRLTSSQAERFIKAKALSEPSSGPVELPRSPEELQHWELDRCLTGPFDDYVETQSLYRDFTGTWIYRQMGSSLEPFGHDEWPTHAEELEVREAIQMLIDHDFKLPSDLFSEFADLAFSETAGTPEAQTPNRPQCSLVIVDDLHCKIRFAPTGEEFDLHSAPKTYQALKTIIKSFEWKPDGLTNSELSNLCDASGDPRRLVEDFLRKEEHAALNSAIAREGTNREMRWRARTVVEIIGTS